MTAAFPAAHVQAHVRLALSPREILSTRSILMSASAVAPAQTDVRLALSKLSNSFHLKELLFSRRKTAVLFVLQRASCKIQHFASTILRQNKKYCTVSGADGASVHAAFCFSPAQKGIRKKPIHPRTIPSAAPAATSQTKCTPAITRTAARKIPAARITAPAGGHTHNTAIPII